MELDARKLRILQAIIDDYILTAAPVGSRTIAKCTDIGLSSATIRNEMSDLEGMGFLEQPHTSAGRVPSDKAYRLYVNSIMRRAMLTGDEIAAIRDHYSQRIGDVDEIVKQTANVLSSITKYTSMVLSPRLHAARLRYIHLVPLSDNRALLVIVTDAGLARDFMIRVPTGFDDYGLEKLSRLLNARLSGHRLDEIGTLRLGELTGELAEEKSFLDAILASLQVSLDEGPRRVELSGARNILNFPEYSDVERARNLLTAIERKDLLYRMLMERGDVEFTITIGGENENAEMRDCSIVTAKYRIGDEPIGSFGIIGPTRMNYARVVAVMSQIGMSLSELLTNMFEEEHREH
ncbi:MAG TPA: heat-inducible transcriptional repressor HrcA [Clostridia bacterium]|nr:heat-inducible transcriptional repressor HrcA [Clostridia bacterium]